MSVVFLLEKKSIKSDVVGTKLFVKLSCHLQ